MKLHFCHLSVQAQTIQVLQYDACLKSRLVLQVHDELLIETKKDELEIVSRILEEEMKGAAKLSVELEVDMHEGGNWYEAK